MSAIGLNPTRRQDAYLLSFLGFFLFIFVSLASDFIPAGREAVHLLIEKCLEKCAGLTPVISSAFYGLRSLLVFGLPFLLIFALAKSLSQVLRARVFSRSLTWADIPPRLKRLLTESDLSPSQVRPFPCRLRFACTVGLFSPKILLSTQIVESLKDEEVQAVLRHEQSHLRRRDPLRGTLIVFFAHFFFFLPLARKLRKDSRRDAEMIADHHALTRSCPAASLASALVKVRRENLAAVRELDGFAGDDFLGERLSRILDMKIGINVQPRRPAIIRIAANLALASVLMFLVLPSGKGFPNTLFRHCSRTDHAACCADEEIGRSHSLCHL